MGPAQRLWMPIAMLLLVTSSLAHGGMVPYTVRSATADAFGAKQLNGNPPTYELRRNASSTSWVLFLEGGGWCFGATAEATISSCTTRAGFKRWVEGETLDYGGILGGDCVLNPGFCGWNAVFLHYRDGASFGSNRADPISVKFANGSAGARLWMRGRPSFDAIVYELQTIHGMSAASEVATFTKYTSRPQSFLIYVPQVILSGGSAGGLAVFYNLDHLGELLGPSVRLTGFPDAGFFLDEPSQQSASYTYRQNFIAADPVWNVTGSQGTNAHCLEAYAKEESWKCLMAQYITPHLQTPVFIMNSAYDAYQLPNIGGLTLCPVSTQEKPCNDTAAQMYGMRFKGIVKAAIAHDTRNGMFVDSCYVHEQNVNYCSTQTMPNCVGWDPRESGSLKWNYTTQVMGFTPQQAFDRWYHQQVNTMLLDDAVLQQNPSCIYHTP